MFKRSFLALALATAMVSQAQAAGQPDMNTLSQSGFVIGPATPNYPLGATWKDLAAVMKNVNVLDPIVDKMEQTICGNQANKSVLVVGDSSLAYQYLFARLANRGSSICPANMFHVEINVSKVEAGHKYVGEVDEYWQNSILRPADGRDVVLYLTSLESLVGIGSHSNDETGIEREYVANYTQGRIRTVAFSDRFEYNNLVGGRNAYVAESFADKVVLPPVTIAQVKYIAAAYLATLYPNVKINETEMDYMLQMAAFYMPNRGEPDRTMSIINQMIRELPGKGAQSHTVKREEARRAVMLTAQVPGWLIDRDYSVIRDLQSKLDGDVVGVTEGKKDLVRLAKNGYAAGRTDDKPVATVLFAGPTGTGKSYIAKQMATYMGMRLVTIDMTTYKDPSSFASFQATMAQNLVNTPYAFYLFEEIDKASIEVLDQLYFMMDEGIFYDRHQRPLFARGAYLMMTTNAASDTILKNKDAPNLRSLVMEDLLKNFRPSFLNRFDAVSVFKPFTNAEYLRLAHVLTDKKIEKTEKAFTWNLKVTDDVYNYIAKFGQDPLFGARPMERLVEGLLGIGISEYQIAIGPIPDYSEVSFTKASGEHNFKIAVKGGKSLEFTVDHNMNGIWSPLDQFPELKRVLQSDRMFDDK